MIIRGRHRILPVAIDRAVMLPSEFQRALDLEENFSAPRATTLIADDAATDSEAEDREMDAERRGNTTWMLPEESSDPT